ncbi:hypothetical protein ACR3K2_09410 [Cryptosporidium serpentis]
MEEGNSIDENKIIDIHQYQSINNDLHGSREVSHECKMCRSISQSLKICREYIGDPLAFIFLFYNRYSGGNIEDFFLSSLQEIVMEVDGITVHINFIDMINQMEKGIQKVKNVLEITMKDVCIIAIGGDGSLSTLVDNFSTNLSKSMNRLVFAVLPFGTGNDWARNFGWYSYNKMTFIKDDLYPMVDLVRGILTSKVINFDVWNIEMEIYDNEDASFLQVSPYSQELQVICNDNQGTVKLKILKRRCLNYFSFGEESKVGITVETYRKRNVLLNRALYGIAGSIFTVNINSKSELSLYHSTKEVVIMDPTNGSNYGCGMCPVGTYHPINEACPTLTNSISLVFLNIASFGGGVQIWKDSSNLGPSLCSITKKYSTFEDTKDTSTSDILNIKQSVQDKKLEIMSFTALVDISSIFVPYMNTAKRVGQFIPFPEKMDLFREYNGSDDNKIYKDGHKNDNDDKTYDRNSKTGSLNEDNIDKLPLLRGGKKLKLSFQNFSEGEFQKLIEIYFQIDGEYYIARYPKHCLISYDREIKILQCVLPYRPFKA